MPKSLQKHFGVPTTLVQLCTIPSKNTLFMPGTGSYNEEFETQVIPSGNARLRTNRIDNRQFLWILSVKLT